jgi:hypothetical protein
VNYARTRVVARATRESTNFSLFARLFAMHALDDGTYDAFIIDAEEIFEEKRDRGVLHLEITITSGARKGEVVRVRAEGLRADAIALIGMPATLTVIDGQPNVRVDD